MDVLQNNNQTTEFAQALEQANLDEQLNNAGPFTVFAPTNEAFNSLRDWQKTDENILLNHIFTGLATARRLRVMSNVTSLGGKTVTISGDQGNISIASQPIIENNIRANNGVVHIIDGVIR
ncbi:MAG TPA: fasciclin domain-containing protein [Balneolaceae bacterium]|nr:fasciclin domain-containing protein [Balneolaceae bacterium]